MNDSLKKISVKIFRPILERLEKRLEAACLRRDAYLNRVLEVELPHLDEEGAENSPEAQQFIADRLDPLARKQVSLALRSDLIERLNEICARKRIVRDAFFNRLFFLLAATENDINKLFFGGDRMWRDEAAEQLLDICLESASSKENPDPIVSELLEPIRTVLNPFFVLRRGLELYGEEGEMRLSKYEEEGWRRRVGDKSLGTGVYSTVWTDEFNEKSHLYGLNCYLPNDQIPDHPEEQGSRQATEDLLALLSQTRR